MWRPRRSRFGELVQWDTSDHNWLEGRGEKLYLIAMIDDATSRLFARFVRHDSTEENMKLVVSGGGGGSHFGGPGGATPRRLDGGEWRQGGVVNKHSALRAGIFKA